MTTHKTVTAAAEQQGYKYTANTPRFAVTLFNDLGAKTKSDKQATLFGLYGAVFKPKKEYPEKAAMPLIKLARFGAKRTVKGSLRHDANILVVTGVEGDYDGEQIALDEAKDALARAGIASVLFTSPSHTPEKPRWRVLVPLSREYPPTERARFVARLNGVLGGVLAAESFTASQAFYFGKVAGTTYAAAMTRGRCIDELDKLDAGAIWPVGRGPNGDLQAGRGTAGSEPDPLCVPPPETIADLRSALNYLRADDRDLWQRMGHALKGMGATGRELWLTWSQTSDKFDAADAARVWNSFKPERTDYRAVFADAQRHGWVNPRKSLSAVSNIAEHSELPRFRCLANIPREPVRWLWPGRIALGKLTLVAGDPGLGKSQLSAALAAVVSTGGRWPVDRTGCEAGNVILLNAEDDAADTIGPRLDAAGADSTRVYTLDAIPAKAGDGKLIERGFNLAVDLDELAQMAEHVGNVRLIVIDPLSAYLGGTDSHKNAEVRALLAPLSELAARIGAAVVIITHLNKSGAVGGAMHRVTGSGAFVAACRAAWLVTKDVQDEGRRLFLAMKNNIGPDSNTGLAFRVAPYTLADGNTTSRLEWEAEPVSITANEALAATADAGNGQPNRREVVTWLRSYLAEGNPVPANEVKRAAVEAGFQERAIERAMRPAGVVSKRVGFGRDARYVWALQNACPPHAPPFPNVGEHGVHGEHGAVDLDVSGIEGSS
jgi:hypothetical protein